jgi:hypothetical protein
MFELVHITWVLTQTNISHFYKGLEELSGHLIGLISDKLFQYVFFKKLCFIIIFLNSDLL